MLLSSPAYFAFLAVLFFVYWALAQRRTAAVGLLLFANYFFYAKWDLRYLLLIPIASSIDFLIGWGLSRVAQPSLRRLLVGLSVLLNLGLIASLKYLPVSTHWSLPLGLSFYAFQALTYTIDIYRQDARPTASYLQYLTAVSFFPTTLAGPITRVSSLLSQLQKGKLLTAQDGGRALFLIGLGLTKKLLIADYLAEQLVNRVFDLPKLYSGAEVLLGVYGYAWQLYYDFSGYTDIALGSALLLGIVLPINFNRPYAAESVADFWKRWHLSLSHWLRDYLYFALPGKRVKVFVYGNLVVTMVLGGLWHGPSWTFVAWGLLHGIALAGTRLYEAWRGKRVVPPTWGTSFVCGVLTFHFVLFAWVFFRAATLDQAWDVLAQATSGTVSFVNVTPGYLFILLLAAGAHYLPPNWYQRVLQSFTAAPAYVQAAALALLVLSIRYVAATGAAPFLYTQF